MFGVKSGVGLNLNFEFESAHELLMNLNLNSTFAKSMNLNLVFSKSMNLNSRIKTKLDGSLPANPVNDRRVVYNAVTLKSTFCQP